jgi:hypothetical protein
MAMPHPYAYARLNKITNKEVGLELSKGDRY